MSTQFKPGDSFSDFHILSIKALPEYRSQGIYIKHRGTGARLYHLVNDDEENLFAFGFKTPPRNNRGTAHIVEHAVLSGSERFPVKDPFIELIRGSMKTFLNAMTYPDKTIYPASSTIERDFYNLMLVAGDAVFFPLLRKEVFLQEGHRLLLKDNKQLEITGIVFNEMKGNYSSPDSIAGEWSYRSLFPDSPYRFDSGGEPEAIMTLSYEEFLEFHKQYYHPSNCFIFLYGNIPTERHLSFIERNFLSSFTSVSIDTSLRNQARRTTPGTTEKTYPIGKNESTERKTILSINWLCNDITDSVTSLGMEVLSEALLGNPGSPLHKRIIDSGLGEDIAPISGYDENIKETVYSIGIRGSDPENAKQFEELVLDEIEKLMKEGVPHDVLEGAVYRTEFRNREIPESIPFGLRLMSKTYRGWIHDIEPESTLEFTKPMEKIKQKLAEEPAYFSDLLRRFFLENNHRTTVIVKPDPHYLEKREAEQQARLEEKMRGLSEDELRGITRENKLLYVFQETPDSEEDLKKIPTLAIDDLPRAVDIIETEKSDFYGVPLYAHDLFTNEVIYIDVAFEFTNMDDHIALLPLFSKALYSMGLPGLSYDKVSRELSTCTGGFGFALEAGGLPLEPGRGKQFIYFRIKTLKETVEKAIRLITRFFTETNFADDKRFRELLFEKRNNMKAALIPRGNSFASLRASGYVSPILAAEEKWRGIDQLLFLNDLFESTEKQSKPYSELREAMLHLREELFTRKDLSINITCPHSLLSVTKDALRGFVTSLPEKGRGPRAPAAPSLYCSDSTITNEGVVVSSSVGFAAKVFPSSLLGSEEYGVETVLAHLLSTGSLWQKIRVSGGAYGASASSNGTEGLFSFSTYRDPDAAGSLGIFRESLESIAKGNLSPEEVKNAVIGTVGKDARPLAGRRRGFTGFRRDLYKINDELRQQKRDTILSTDCGKLKKTAAGLLERYNEGAAVVLAGREVIERVAELNGKVDRTVTV